MDKRTIRIQKLIPGTLVMEFHDAITYGETRSFVIPAGRDYINLDIDYVVSMFQLTGTMGLYKRGYFTFSQEDKEAVFKRARELSLYYGDDDGGSDASYEQPSVLYTEKQIQEMLRLKRLGDIQKIINEGNRPQHTLLVEVARKSLGNLSLDVIRVIENGLGVQLDEGDD